jgi:hypothetical protein
MTCKKCSTRAYSRASILDFRSVPHQKVKGDLSCERPPLLSEFSKIRFGTESQRHVISVLSGTCRAVRPRLSRTNRYHRRCKRSLGSIALLSVAQSLG